MRWTVVYHLDRWFVQSEGDGAETLVFCKNRAEADDLAAELNRKEPPAAPIGAAK